MNEPQLSPADVLEERVSDSILSQQKTTIAIAKMHGIHELLWAFFKSEVTNGNINALPVLAQIETLLQHAQ